MSSAGGTPQFELLLDQTHRNGGDAVSDDGETAQGCATAGQVHDGNRKLPCVWPAIRLDICDETLDEADNVDRYGCGVGSGRG